LVSEPFFDRSRRRQVRFEQPVQVDDDIAHFGIVDRALRRGAPRIFGALVIADP
jgi:hypothetical protein